MADKSGFLVRGRNNQYKLSLSDSEDTNIHCTPRKSILTSILMLQHLVAIPDVASFRVMKS
jgi:hypothetical protein